MGVCASLFCVKEEKRGREERGKGRGVKKGAREGERGRIEDIHCTHADS